jgi:deoxyribodipyrimidine photo-lyase
MAQATIVWFRNDLRVTDNPSLHEAAQKGGVYPVFVLDTALLESSRVSSNRNRFLLESLEDLKQSLKDLGSDLIILDSFDELVELADKLAAAVHYTIDYTPHGRSRDVRMSKQFEERQIEFIGFPGKLIVDSVQGIETKSGNTMKVFTPFYKQWMQLERRTVHRKPSRLSSLPSTIKVGRIPAVDSVTTEDTLSPDVLQGGETAARKRLEAFLKTDLQDYKKYSNDLGADKTSRLSSFLHFGCISSREIESRLGTDAASSAFRRQLCWRDFYHYILLHYPKNRTQEFQSKYHSASWSKSKKQLEAWQQAKTGYPIVDAAMTQLKQEGWMHNRARLIVGSFLTKDLGIDWREGETWFLQWLIDGDMANNNGNWQWIASVGVDPAPVFRRLYNPASQQDKYDHDGTYIRRYLPVFKKVPTKHLAEPWKMTDDEQKEYDCIIGTSYPRPIVDHKEARQDALEWYKQVASSDK